MKSGEDIWSLYDLLIYTATHRNSQTILATMASNDKNDISQLEQTVSQPDDLNKDHINYDRIDKELAQYASAGRVEITAEDDKRLKRMIDKRVLSIMIFTYFLQALDKGTMSFASIMGIQEDLDLAHGQRASYSSHSFLLHRLTCIVPMAYDMYLHRCPDG